MVSDHKKALAQAEKLEEEFVALMTGHRIKNKRDSSNVSIVCIIIDASISYLKIIIILRSLTRLQALVE